MAPAESKKRPYSTWDQIRLRFLALVVTLVVVGMTAAGGVSHHAYSAEPEVAAGFASTAQTAYDKRDFAEALQSASGAVHKNPIEPRYRDLRGKARFESGDVDGALEDF